MIACTQAGNKKMQSLQKVSGELSSQQITMVRCQIHQFIYDMNIFFSKIVNS